MRILLFTLNARFSHSSLALRYIHAYWQLHAHRFPDVEVELLEYSINTDPDHVLARLHGRYDAIFASAYIWNIAGYRTLFANLSRIDPVPVILGGPEVTYIDEAPDFASAVIRGEGEEAFVRFVEIAASGGIPAALADTRLLFQERRIHKLADIDAVPFPYRTADPSTDHKTIYYETSRGCPYRCSYCLSAIDPGVRFLPLDRVLREIGQLIADGYRTVKFVDRTFNTDRERFRAIVSHILALDRGATSFHFEINAALLRPSDIALLAEARPGLFKLEAGIQSTHARTIEAIDRTIDTQRVIERCKQIVAETAVDLHVDLIAGLPFETLHNFFQSFDDVFAIGAQQFQLGFLKVLSGTPIARQRDAYGLVTRVNPPYEVLATRWMSFTDLELLHRIESIMDHLHPRSLAYTFPRLLEGRFHRPSALYHSLAEHFRTLDAFEGGFSREQAFRHLHDYICRGCHVEEGKASAADASRLRGLLMIDYLLAGNNSIPSWFDGAVSDSLRLRRQILALPQCERLLGCVVPSGSVSRWKLIALPSATTDDLDVARLEIPPEVALPRFDGRESYVLLQPDDKQVILLDMLSQRISGGALLI